MSLTNITNDTCYDVKNLNMTDYISSYYPVYVECIKMENGYYEHCGNQIYFDSIRINKKDYVQLCIEVCARPNDEIINYINIEDYEIE